MHASSKVDVYLSVTSNPIIEHCKDIWFSPYPKALAPSSVTEKVSSFAIVLTDLWMTCQRSSFPRSPFKIFLISERLLRPIML